MLDCSAIVLANLCVCYILTESNEAAEEVMKRTERAEAQQPERHFFHLCIINLVIGTLYCAKVAKPRVCNPQRLRTYLTAGQL